MHYCPACDESCECLPGDTSETSCTCLCGEDDDFIDETEDFTDDEEPTKEDDEDFL